MPKYLRAEWVSPSISVPVGPRARGSEDADFRLARVELTASYT